MRIKIVILSIFSILLFASSSVMVAVAKTSFGQASCTGKDNTKTNFVCCASGFNDPGHVGVDTWWAIKTAGSHPSDNAPEKAILTYCYPHYLVSPFNKAVCGKNDPVITSDVKYSNGLSPKTYCEIEYKDAEIKLKYKYPI